MMKLLLGCSAAAGLVAIVPAVAQPAPPPGVAQGTTAVAPVPAVPRIQTHVSRMPMKTETRDEVVAHVRDMFERLDTNKDGFVTRAEADAAHQAMAGEIRQKFARHFADGGMPHPDRGAMFDKLDTNKDGSISRQEFMSAKPDVRERHMFVMRDGEGPVAVDGRPGQPHGKVMRMHDFGSRMHGIGMRMHGKMFESADGNRDGKVSLQEMTNAALQHFDRADANHDGKLTPDERMQMHQRRKDKPKRPA